MRHIWIFALTICKREHHAKSPACRGLQAHLPRLALTIATQLLDRHGPDRGGGPDGIRPGRRCLPTGRGTGIPSNHRPQQHHAAAGTLATRTASGHGRPTPVAGPAALPALWYNTPQNGHAGLADLASKPLCPDGEYESGSSLVSRLYARALSLAYWTENQRSHHDTQLARWYRDLPFPKLAGPFPIAGSRHPLGGSLLHGSTGRDPGGQHHWCGRLGDLPLQPTLGPQIQPAMPSKIP